MFRINRPGKLIYVSSFTPWAAARRFARMIAANVTRLVPLGVAAQDELWGPLSLAPSRGAERLTADSERNVHHTDDLWAAERGASPCTL